ncbi:hypothetical protein APR12_005551 [Nocardia amikacinitolerans]|nr:hypothetical protein [Nocardia amikacinitolerans]
MLLRCNGSRSSVFFDKSDKPESAPIDGRSGVPVAPSDIAAEGSPPEGIPSAAGPLKTQLEGPEGGAAVAVSRGFRPRTPLHPRDRRVLRRWRSLWSYGRSMPTDQPERYHHRTERDRPAQPRLPVRCAVEQHDRPTRRLLGSPEAQHVRVWGGRFRGCRHRCPFGRPVSWRRHRSRDRDKESGTGCAAAGKRNWAVRPLPAAARPSGRFEGSARWSAARIDDPGRHIQRPGRNMVEPRVTL